MSPQEDVRATLAILERHVADRYPGAVRSVPIFEVPGVPVMGFAISAGDGMTLVWADVTGVSGSEWNLQISSGLAVDAPDIDGALRWGNARNRTVAVGKYYSAIAIEAGLAAIVYETVIPGALATQMLSATVDTRLIGSWVVQLLQNNVLTAIEESNTAADVLGGRHFSDDDHDLTLLFTIVSA